MTNNIKTDILALLGTKDLTVDQLLKRLNFYPRHLVIKAINELVKDLTIKFTGIKLTIVK